MIQNLPAWLRSRGVWVLTLAFLLTGLTGLGQERSGEINGVVTDATGAAVPGAKITLTNKAANTTRVATTGEDGAYVERNVLPGRYSIRVEAKGFAVYEVPDVNVLVGRTYKVDANLKIGGIDQVIQVTDTAPLIDTSGVTITHNVTSEEFDRLPKTRTFQGMLLTSPSVNAGEIEGGFQVNGASGAENQFVVDGISTNSLVNGRSRQNAMFEILQEVQVKTAGIDAEFGGALGGVLSAVTKSGGNQFHGDVHYYFFGNPLNASPVRRLSMDPSSERSARHVQDGKFKDNTNEAGFSLGGPILKDKLYFLSAFSPQFRREQRDYLFSSGTEQGTLSRGQTRHMMFNKLSLDPNRLIRANFTWLWTPAKSLGRLPGYDGFVPNSLVTSRADSAANPRIGFFSPQSSYTGQVDITLTHTSLVTVRGGRFWDNYKTTGIPNVSSIEWVTSSTNLPFPIPAGLQRPAGYRSTPRLINTGHDLTTRTFMQADYSTFARFFGQHSFKAGWGVTKSVNSVKEAYPGGGYIRLIWNSAFNFGGLPPAQRGTYGYYQLYELGTEGSTGNNIQNFYFTDQWRVIPRLTLTLGVRFEKERIPSFRRDIQEFAFDFNYGDKIAPRLGASFDVFGDGRMKVYGSWGRYFDWVKYTLARGTFGGDFWRIRYRSLDTLDVLSLSGANLPGRDLWFPGQQYRDLRVPSFGDEAVDPNIKPMSTQLMTGGIELQLGAHSVFRASYVRNVLIRTMEDLGVLVNGSEVYIQANPGEGAAKFVSSATGATPLPIAYPKPRRTYDAMELTCTKRFSNGYFAGASYVLSRLYGNYAGLASSDEITSPATGLVSGGAQGTSAPAREGGNVNRAWDLDEILFDSKGNLDVLGRLATDRPHVFKLYGSKTFRFGADLGLFFYAGSGTPLSTYVMTTHQVPVFVEGRGDMGRTPFFNQTDLLLGHEIKFGEVKRLRLEFNFQNLFNQKTARSRFNYLNRGAGGAQAGSAIDLSGTNLFQGYDYRALINVTPDQAGGRGAYDPRYGLDDIFNPGFAGRLGIKFTF